MNESEPTIEPHLQSLIALICSLEKEYSEIPVMLTSTFRVIFSLVNVAKGLTNRFISEIFTTLLTIESSESVPKIIKSQTAKTIQFLAQETGYKSVAELYSQEVEIILNGYTKEVVSGWNKYSKDRYKFGLIVRNCKGEMSHLLDRVLEVIEQCTHKRFDIELRMDMLVYTEAILKIPELQAPLKKRAVFILRNILIPSTVWKVGQANLKIRKAGIICMIHLIDNKVISS